MVGFCDAIVRDSGDDGGIRDDRKGSRRERDFILRRTWASKAKMPARSCLNSHGYFNETSHHAGNAMSQYNIVEVCGPTAPDPNYRHHIEVSVAILDICL